jgi:hypothetical protein
VREKRSIITKFIETQRILRLVSIFSAYKLDKLKGMYKIQERERVRKRERERQTGRKTERT